MIVVEYEMAWIGLVDRDYYYLKAVAFWVQIIGCGEMELSATEKWKFWIELSCLRAELNGFSLWRML